MVRARTVGVKVVPRAGRPRSVEWAGMYVVILAGGGGPASGRCPHPSGPSRLAAARRADPPPAHRGSVAGRPGAGRRSSVSPCPTSRSSRTGATPRSSAPAARRGRARGADGRNTAAAVAPATVALDRDEDDVMLVLPADQTIEREDDFRAFCATPSEDRPRRLWHRQSSRDAGDPGGPASNRVRVSVARGELPRAGRSFETLIQGSVPTRSAPSRRSRRAIGPRSCCAARALPGTPGSSCGGAGRSAPPSRRSLRTSSARSPPPTRQRPSRRPTGRSARTRSTTR